MTTKLHGGCHPGMPLDQPEPGFGCHARCLHRSLVERYRDAKILSDEARKIAREQVTHGYATEGADFDAAHPPLTFRAFLLDQPRRTPTDTDPD